jgi:regulator of nucleoside diphosphate kinase
MATQSFTVSRHAQRPRIVIAASEHARLTALAEKALTANSAVGEYLIEELSRAHLVPDADFVPHVVRMGSVVTYRDETSGRTRTVTLVYPDAADIARNRISILTPIGAALIGMAPAQSIPWPTPDGRESSLTVLDVRSEDVAA